MRPLYSLPLAALALAAGLISARAETVVEAAERLETELGGRIGVVLREQDGALVATYRADERFPLGSTFKVLACGALLARVDAGEDDLDRMIEYGREELVTYSPVTEKHAGQGMTLRDLCHATITLSDNTAGNLVLESIGGPEGLTEFLRQAGDEVTRLDRWETELNEGRPGDPRDTTSPEAILATLERLLFGELLSPSSRRQLEDWMIADQVADALIRSSLPDDWNIGDKTGAGGRGTRAIVAVIRPPESSPWLAAIYLTGNEADLDTRNRVVAEIGAVMIDTIASR
ncbi:class A beta-lactamase [Lutibaculum baratangense]|uniref:Beta-lactamase n=1 Tax=Lutibaculum baratangense AMV1 TaxID=631454 RepID=V4QXR4_9HYPH|nr:class A beta-lactamase [Lutibaculum baratangense]ESR24527.1 Beta-lactamase [Lutibaculum baratangense AMV1]